MLVKQFDNRGIRKLIRGYLSTPIITSNHVHLFDEGFYINEWQYDGFLAHHNNGNKVNLEVYQGSGLGVIRYKYNF